MKSKFTPAQRLEIYLKAAELIVNSETSFCCHAIEMATGVYPFWANDFVLLSFHEFKMFSPNYSYEDENTAWFLTADETQEYNHIETKEQRLFCLLSCAEIIKQGIPIE